MLKYALVILKKKTYIIIQPLYYVVANQDSLIANNIDNISKL